MTIGNIILLSKFLRGIYLRTWKSTCKAVWKISANISVSVYLWIYKKRI